MGYSLEQSTFIIMSYYRHGVLNEDGDRVYSVDAWCKDEYLVKYPVVIEKESLKTHIGQIVARLNDTGAVSKGKPTGRPQVSEDVVEDLRTRMEQSPKKSLSKLFLQFGVSYYRWVQANMDDNRILDLSFFSDEAWFHLSDYVNSQNFRIWGTENSDAFEGTPLLAVKVGV